MPIAAFKCTSCHSSKVSLDHFAVTTCGLAVHPDYAAAVLGEQEDNFPHGNVRVSAASGCPRSAAIMHTEDVTVDPLIFNAMLTGTAWHSLLGYYGSRNNEDLVEVEVKGTIDGVPMVGHIDRLLPSPSGLVICDWKHSNDFSRKYLKDTAKPEHICQTSLYAELYSQQHGERPIRGCNWYHFTSSPPLVPMWYDLWKIEKCLEHKPHGCDFTVRDLLHQASDFAKGVLKWEDMPLAGEGFNFGGKTGCDYCPTKDICWTHSKCAPF